MAHRLSGFSAGILVGALTIFLFAGAPFAQQPSAGDIANSLAPKTSLTRGPSVARPSTAQDRQFLNGLKNTQLPLRNATRLRKLRKTSQALISKLTLTTHPRSLGLKRSTY
jgi:hypothetical protein